MRRRAVVRWSLRGFGVVCAAALWAAATVPSGYSFTELLIFAGPGMVLAIAMSWSAHLFARGEFTWPRALRAGLIGGAVLPPVLAFSEALTAAGDHGAILVTFVVGAWVALAAGVLTSAIRALRHSSQSSPRSVTPRGAARFSLDRAKSAPPRLSARPGRSSPPASRRRRKVVS